jgi:hypothetical protein
MPIFKKKETKLHTGGPISLTDRLEIPFFNTTVKIEYMGGVFSVSKIQE